MGFLNTLNIGGTDYAISDGGLYGTCSTGAGTAAKVVTCANFDELVEGTTIRVKFTYSNTASNATMNVNSTGAKNLCRYGTTRVGTTERASWKAGAVVSFTYDGTSWVQNDYIEDTGVTTDTKNTAGSTNNDGSMYIIGASSQAANPQTYSQSHVMMENGGVIADSYNGIEISHPVSSGFWLKFQYGTGTPNVLQVPANKSYTLKDACAKGVDTSISSSATDSNVPTSLAVYSAIQSAITGVAEYKGSVSAESSLLNTALTKGWYYIVAMPTTTPPTTSITIGGKTCEAGDMVWIRDSGTYANSAALADHIDIIQSNIDTLTNTEIDTLWTNAVAVS